jgi:PAS domain S-box-containing protein
MSLKEKFLQQIHNKIHLKFLSVSTILLGFIAFGIYSFYVNKFESELVNSQEYQERLIVGQLEKLIKFNSFGHNDSTFKSHIESIISDFDLKQLSITDRNDSLLFGTNLNSLSKTDISKNNKSELTNDKSALKQINHQIEKDGSVIFKLYCEFSRSNLNEKIHNIKSEIGLILLSVLILSLTILFAASFVFTNPIQKISNYAFEIASGKLNKRIPDKKNNEFSLLVKSINNLADDLQQANTQIDNLSKELKFHFRDKIGELNYEINQRRQAEFSLKQSEEQFRLLFELAPIGMVISSIYGEIVKVNAAFHSALGYDEDEIVGMKLRDLTHSEDKELDVDLRNKLFDSVEQNAYHEKRLVRKDGGFIHVIVGAVLVKNKDGKPSHIIEQVIDITDRKRVEKELIFAKEKAEESDRLKGAFLAQMSHEIRTPLNVILTAMHLIQDELDETDEDTNTILDSVSSAGKRLQRTINLILEISAVQSGSYSPDNKDFDLDKELKTMIDEFKTMENEKDLKISYINKTRQSIITSDHYSVMQIFQNLIGNAIKYTIKGSVDVVLDDWNAQKLRIIVKDTGIGISKDYISSLFSPFSQEDVGHKREFEGNGLGLALVKKYCEINNADIAVESEKNKGSTFTVLLNKKSANHIGEIRERISFESDDVIELVE